MFVGVCLGVCGWLLFCLWVVGVGLFGTDYWVLVCVCMCADVGLFRLVVVDDSGLVLGLLLHIPAYIFELIHNIPTANRILTTIPNTPQHPTAPPILPILSLFLNNRILPTR